MSAGLDYPGVGPEHAHLRDTGRATYTAVTDVAALAAFVELSRLEGTTQPLSPHMRSPGCWGERTGGEGYDVLCLARPGRQGPGRGHPDGSGGSLSRATAGSLRAIPPLGRGADPAAFEAARAGGGAALMPYMMAGFPDLEASLGYRGRLRRRRRRPDRAGRAVLGPSRRRPDNPRRRHRGARGGSHARLGAGGLRVRISPGAGGLDGLREHGARPRGGAGIRAPRRRSRGRRSDSPRSPRWTRRAICARPSGRRGLRSCRCLRRPLRRSAAPVSAPPPQASSTWSRPSARPGSARALPAGPCGAGCRSQARRRGAGRGRVRDRDPGTGRAGRGDRRRRHHRQPPHPRRRRGRLAPGGSGRRRRLPPPDPHRACRLGL